MTFAEKMTNALKAATLIAISIKPRPRTLRAAPTSVDENILERSKMQNCYNFS